MVLALYTAVKKYKIPLILISTIISTKSSPFNVQTFQVSQKQMMDQTTNSVVYVKLLRGPMERKSREGRRLDYPRGQRSFSLPCAISYFLTKANAQWEIHGFTLAYTAELMNLCTFHKKQCQSTKDENSNSTHN